MKTSGDLIKSYGLTAIEAKNILSVCGENIKAADWLLNILTSNGMPKLSNIDWEAVGMVANHVNGCEKEKAIVK